VQAQRSFYVWSATEDRDRMLYTQLRAFDAVAREGSFSRAATVLGVTQPALTIQVRALEAAYGMKLFVRQGRAIALTDVGERLYRKSRQLAALEDEIRATLDASQGAKRGSLRLAVDGPHIVMGLFARFLERFPDVALSVAAGNTSFVRQQLLDRRVDLAILPGVQKHPRIHAVPLWYHTAVLIVPSTHAWAGRRAINIEDLHEQPMIAREEGSMTRRLVNEALARAGVKPKVVLELGSREAVCEAVSAGLGHGVIWEIEAYGAARFRTLPFRNAKIQSTDYVACLKSDRMRPLVKALFQVAAALPGKKTDIRALWR
jgi:aminoethylphosphonate catabolism LysR family transcriptional regulator